jgi:hypothetical protein
MPTHPAPWSVAIFTARESIGTLTCCVKAAVAACAGREATVEILVNGNRALADEAAQLLASIAAPPGVAVRVWFIALGDKAHTWNEYVYRISKEGCLAFFVDGYAEVRPDAFRLIEEALAVNGEALAVSAVPSSGRTAAALRAHMLREGGIHGNLYALRAAAMQDLRKAEFRLPLGLYRTDPMMGAVLMYRFDPATYKWDAKAIHVHPDATWDVHQGPVWTFSNMMVLWRRKLRQAQGDLENRAVREHLSIQKRPPRELPNTTRELVGNWIASRGSEARKLMIFNPLAFYAAGKLDNQQRDWSGTATPPELLATSALNHSAARMAG